ncbi:MAG: SDR family oxidoreductase [Desulfomicrobium sp.]|uniref:SDR family NAD(P)-dependent oxidoreductase n=1 Tax=Hoeflea sp. TaxID=1940281 RepID=UPI0025BD9394|nr:SDR family NAD(P)-dependent oxidoreductase [Hoeflea sp.]MBU4528984.1 SDR family oxidoreductase [Alphaproteobacteria bacterium]MBV1711571.1 SDR family oxidoreductase [Desulfomicrobium sp.]MBU4545050.1 SDR family oxidoreductase [Alphaproteobacteria bacterium]MBU4550103.1 SDR family oxidoreductase [Alphaproteobacteria bacterium]MBV1785630.1 SDR family oxidoreductase [Hoeflea sp.]
MTGVRDRVALVTGAGSPEGIGFATARLLLAAGAKVAITSTTSRIFDRLENLGGGADTIFAKPADLTKAVEVEELCLAIASRLGPVDILINNAGMVQESRDEPPVQFADMTAESWNYGIDINLTTAFLTTRAVLPGMIGRNYGRIVFMSSVTGPVTGISGSSVYSAAKAGLLGLTRTLAIEAGANNVTVNSIGPGWIETGSSSESEIVAGRHTPVGRPGKPDEIGHVAVFLASEEASYLTGQLIVVDGGNTIQEYKADS